MLFQRIECCYTQEHVAAVIAVMFGYERKNLLSALSVSSGSGDLVGSYWNESLGTDAVVVITVGFICPGYEFRNTFSQT